MKLVDIRIAAARIHPVVFAAAIIFAAGAAANPTGTEFDPFGIDLSAQDESIKPGDDFFHFADGHWLTREKIPADRTSWGVTAMLREQADADVKSIIEGTAPQKAQTGTDQRKIGDFYRSFLDTARIEQLGLAPAKPGLDAISKLRNHRDVAALIATPGMPLDGPIGYNISLDRKNPDRYVVVIGQSGLSLPDREYYLKMEPTFVDIRAKFLAHVEKMLSLVGRKDAKADAVQILELETQIAKLHWERAKRRDLDLVYNLKTVDALKREAPGYPWDPAFKASGLHNIKEAVVEELSAIPPLAKLFADTPVASWRAYLTYRYLTSEAAVLPKAFDDENFEFYGRMLNGQPQQRERWKRAVQVTNNALGEAVGKLYVEQKFPPSSKFAMEALVENLRRGYAQHIAAVPWMSEETKKVAFDKLSAFHPKIGYPVKWRDYSALEVRAEDAFGNRERAEIFEWNRELKRLNMPTDRDEWSMTPQTVNAYYNPVFNEVVFPAAILQPPFFNPKADPAVNYGAIGGVIGHEMGHGFDDQGAKSDAKGVLHTWWRPEDIEAFKKRTDALAGQYSQFEPLAGLHLNGRLTLGENIGDLGGLTIAHDAYLISLAGKQPPSIDGYTADQRFFLAWAQMWRTLSRDEALRNQVMTDPHSPGEYRVNGVVRNVDAWYSAFDVGPGDHLYLAPDQRVRIW